MSFCLNYMINRYHGNGEVSIDDKRKIGNNTKDIAKHSSNFYWQ